MKNTLIAILLTAIAAGHVRAVELESINLGNLPPASVEVPANVVPGFLKTDVSWAREAARELRKELNERGIYARVSVTTWHNGQPALLVEFANNEDYEIISDLFYQDPGAPSYMDVKVVVQIGSVKSESCEETLRRLGNKVTDMQIKYRAATLEERAAMRPELEAALAEYAACQVSMLRGQAACTQAVMAERVAPDTFRPSKNYKKLVLNPDSSSTIVQPRFSYSNNSGRIDILSSSAEGVCKLFGYPAYVTHTTGVEYYFHDLAVINQDGKLGGIQIKSPTAFNSIICSDGRTPVKSRQYADKRENDDGSVTIIQPRFDYEGTNNSGRIDILSSSAEGVCKLFGYPAYVTHTTGVEYYFRDLAVINQDGKIKGVQTKSPTAFDTIVCR